MLKKYNRLSKGYEFRKVHNFGKKFSSPFFYLYILETKYHERPFKAGVVVSNKTMKTAVKRNRLKRLFRELLRHNSAKISQGVWLVLHPKPACLDRTYEELNTEFVKVLQNVFISR